MDISTKTVHFLGDSITEGHGASVREKTCFVSLFQKAYPNAKITNYGIGGTRIARQTNASAIPRHDLDFNMRALEMTDNADLVVVFGSTNDFGHGDAPFGEWGDQEETTFCGAVYALYEKLLCKYPLSRILVLTPLHRETEEVSNMHGKVLKDYVDIIRKTAELFSFPVLDLYAVAGINPRMGKVKEMMMPDGLHPNDTGYQRLFHIIDQYIKGM